MRKTACSRIVFFLTRPWINEKNNKTTEGKTREGTERENEFECTSDGADKRDATHRRSAVNPTFAHAGSSQSVFVLARVAVVWT